MVSSAGSGVGGGTTSGVVVAPDVDGPGAGAVVEAEYASWGQRVVAALLDNAILAGVAWLALGAGFNAPMLVPVWSGTTEAARSGGPLVLVPVAALVLLLLLQALTGWTPGKLVTGIRVVREDEHRPAGLGRTLARWVLHLLDAILLIGYLRPVWHAKRQTFADSIVRTVVLREVLDLPRRPRIALYSAAVVVCVLGLGYGYVPISSGSSADVADHSPLCEVETPEPTLVAGEIRPAGSVSINRDRRLWTVRETRTTHPGAILTWTSDPSARDTGYRVELDARAGDGEDVLISRSWDIGTSDAGSSSDNAGFTHTRTIAADGDTHDVRVDVTDPDPDAEAALTVLGDEPWIDVRLLADGDVVASCGGPVTYTEAPRD
ncbi:RDD family protein [Promicromonospora sukumoe]|uniref:RDD family protein n=1 Tax=Promicromonospora sukumoe TaxID=88382 RepID=UPI000375CB68|nr:RDD family protein [Promicromonospora sukumoe]